jgi:hypothetical protein
MPDNSKDQCKWLTYSEEADKAFSLPCLLFKLPGMQGGQQKLWPRDGYRNWGNAVRDILTHETLAPYKECEFLHVRCLRGQVIDSISRIIHIVSRQTFRHKQATKYSANKRYFVRL